MLSFNKDEIKESLTLDNIFELLNDWGGDPIYSSFGIISATICHNPPGEGSKKLYFYENSGLFKCYTGCDATFDIFELAIKVMDIQHNQHFDLNDAVRYVAAHFGILGTSEFIKKEDSEDFDLFTKYESLDGIEIVDNHIVLKEYDPTILDRMVYSLRIKPWLDDGISQEIIDRNRIGFYPGGAQITIPHFDNKGRFVGLRGRSLVKEEAEQYGKYRPVMVNNKIYNHPLGMNLYNLNNSQNNIRFFEKAVVFESEKSCLLYQTNFGIQNDISVACCGSNLSIHQVDLLLEAGAKEIIVAFDRQFKELNDKEFKHLTNNLTKIHEKYHQIVNISFIFDKHRITEYKAGPLDEGPDKFLKLYKERVLL